MNQELIDAVGKVAELQKDATPGPWQTDGFTSVLTVAKDQPVYDWSRPLGGGKFPVTGHDHSRIAHLDDGEYIENPKGREDADFIAAARNLDYAALHAALTAPAAPFYNVGAAAPFGYLPIYEGCELPPVGDKVVLLNNYGTAALAPVFGRLAHDKDGPYWRVDGEQWAFTNFTHYHLLGPRPTVHETINRAAPAAGAAPLGVVGGGAATPATEVGGAAGEVIKRRFQVQYQPKSGPKKWINMKDSETNTLAEARHYLEEFGDKWERVIYRIVQTTHSVVGAAPASLVAGGGAGEGLAGQLRNCYAILQEEGHDAAGRWEGTQDDGGYDGEIYSIVDNEGHERVLTGASPEVVDFVLTAHRLATALSAAPSVASVVEGGSVSMQGWRPAKTAPKDGERVLLLLQNRGVVLGSWEDDLIDAPKRNKPLRRVGGWTTGVVISWGMQEDERFAESEIIGWQPLPAAPATLTSTPTGEEGGRDAA